MTDVLHPHPLQATSGRWRTPKVIRWVVISLFVIGAILGGYLWLEIYRSNLGVVVPGEIYRSAQMPPLILKHELEANHIGIIIFLSDVAEDGADAHKETQIAADRGIPFLNYPMKGDGVASPQMYTDALLALCRAVQAGTPVLVHCHSGAQRTGGVIAVYRMLVEGMPPEQALAEMRYYGHDPRKNKTLIPFLNEHIGEWAAALVKGGIISHVPDPMPMLNPNVTP
jgi:predicted protein tyrosine phosphatase